MVVALPWIRLDTNVHTHDKMFALAEYGDKGLAAAFVYVASLAYSGANGSDGIIPRRALPFLHGTQKHAKLLVEVQLWDQFGTGWVVHNYGTRNVVGAIQQVISESFSEAGKKGAAARWGRSETAEAISPPIGQATPHDHGQAISPPKSDRNGTVRNGTNERPPRLRSVISSPERAREKRAEAQRELDQIQTAKTGDTA